MSLEVQVTKQNSDAETLIRFSTEQGYMELYGELKFVTNVFQDAFRRPSFLGQRWKEGFDESSPEKQEEILETLQLSFRGWKVWRLNECDWVAATSVEAAIEWYEKATGLPRDEALDDNFTGAYSPQFTKMSDEEGGLEITFRRVLEEMHSNGTLAEPFTICSIDY